MNTTMMRLKAEIMTTDLKKGNQPTIFSILAATLLLCAGFQFGFDKLPELKEMALAGTASALFSAVLIMLTNILPANIKHKLVFTRFVNEMPAGRCHSLCARDSRIDVDIAKERWPSTFNPLITQADRNGLWYREIYKPVKDSNEVMQSHRSFLLYRDLFSGLIIILISAVCWKFWGDPKQLGVLNNEVFIILSLFTFTSLIAARNSGNRLVTNAVAKAI